MEGHFKVALTKLDTDCCTSTIIHSDISFGKFEEILSKICGGFSAVRVCGCCGAVVCCGVRSVLEV